MREAPVTATTVDLAGLPPARLDMPVLRAVRPGVELRAADDGNGVGTLVGHFSVFNRWFEINSFWEGHFLERVAPGAFSKTFGDWRNAGDPHRIQVLLEHGHDPTVGDKPLGVARALSEDATGAGYEARLFDAAYVRELVPAIAAGVYGASYRFQVIQDAWDQEPEASEQNPNGLPERTITENRVYEFGPTVWPANPHATAGMRSACLTDHYYDMLRAAHPQEYDDLLGRTQRARTPAADGTGAATHNPAEPPRGTRRFPEQLLTQINLRRGSR
jgi:HK97 family phage prohead protease